MKRTVRSFQNAGRGIGYALKGRNFKIDVAAAIVVLAAGWYLRISHSDWIAIILCIGLVMSAEAANSAIEEICNKFHPETHPHIALIKDLAAGSVLIAAIAAAIVGLIVFLPYL